MSDLQILLISIGVVLIVLVLVYNGWQDWRARRSINQSLPETGHDVLMQGAGVRKEPGIWQAGQPVSDDNTDVDAACEAVLDVTMAQPVPGSALVEALRSISRVGQKPVRVLLQREGGGQRAYPRPDESYVSLQLVVLLANRSGHLTDIEWSNLWTLAQNLAERFEGLIEAPDQDAVLQKAVELDAHCASMDAQVGLILQLARPAPQAEIVQAAIEAGFVRLDAQLAWMSENGVPRFVLEVDASSDPAHRLDLVLDVPNSMPDDQAFSRMVAVARDLATRLDAHVLDDQGRTFQDDSAPAIDRQISAMYDQLEQAGFLAGTDRTARVFS